MPFRVSPVLLGPTRVPRAPPRRIENSHFTPPIAATYPLLTYIWSSHLHFLGRVIPPKEKHIKNKRSASIKTKRPASQKASVNSLESSVNAAPQKHKISLGKLTYALNGLFGKHYYRAIESHVGGAAETYWGKCITRAWRITKAQTYGEKLTEASGLKDEDARTQANLDMLEEMKMDLQAEMETWEGQGQQEQGEKIGTREDGQPTPFALGMDQESVFQNMVQHSDTSITAQLQSGQMEDTTNANKSRHNKCIDQDAEALPSWAQPLTDNLSTYNNTIPPWASFLSEYPENTISANSSLTMYSPIRQHHASIVLDVMPVGSAYPSSHLLHLYHDVLINHPTLSREAYDARIVPLSIAPNREFEPLRNLRFKSFDYFFLVALKRHIGKARQGVDLMREPEEQMRMQDERNHNSGRAGRWGRWGVWEEQVREGEIKPIGLGRFQGYRGQKIWRLNQRQKGRFGVLESQEKERAKTLEKERAKPQEKKRIKPQEEQQANSQERKRALSQEKDRAKSERANLHQKKGANSQEKEQATSQEKGRAKSQEQKRIKPQEKQQANSQERKRAISQEKDRAKSERANLHQKKGANSQEKEQATSQEKGRAKSQEKKRIKPQEKQQANSQERKRAISQEKDRAKSERAKSQEKEQATNSVVSDSVVPADNLPMEPNASTSSPSETLVYLGTKSPKPITPPSQIPLSNPPESSEKALPLPHPPSIAFTNPPSSPDSNTLPSSDLPPPSSTSNAEAPPRSKPHFESWSIRTGLLESLDDLHWAWIDTKTLPQAPKQPWSKTEDLSSEKDEDNSSKSDEDQLHIDMRLDTLYSWQEANKSAEVENANPDATHKEGVDKQPQDAGSTVTARQGGSEIGNRSTGSIEEDESWEKAEARLLKLREEITSVSSNQWNKRFEQPQYGTENREDVKHAGFTTPEGMRWRELWLSKKQKKKKEGEKGGKGVSGEKKTLTTSMLRGIERKRKRAEEQDRQREIEEKKTPEEIEKEKVEYEEALAQKSKKKRERRERIKEEIEEESAEAKEQRRAKSKREEIRWRQKKPREKIWVKWQL